MRLTVLQRRDDPGFHPVSAVFQAPGGTLGRSADNHLALPDSERDICRIQAALRISGEACYLVNLSGMGSVSVNGRTITRDQEVPLEPGDELAIGPYTLKAEDPFAPATVVAAGAVGAAALHDPLLAEADPLLAESEPAPAEPDPLLDSPLIEGADLTPPTTQAAHTPAATAAIPNTPATAASDTVAPDTAAVPAAAAPATPAHGTAAQDTAAQNTGAAAAPAVDVQPAAAAAKASDPRRAFDTYVEGVDLTLPHRQAAPSPTADASPPAVSPATAMPDTADTASGMPAPDAAPTPPYDPGTYPESDRTRFDAPFGGLEPQAAQAQPPQSNPSDVFSDLFGPGTLPVGSVPDVSAHPFDLESAQTRNPEDPLRQLPRGDANVSGPARDPLDLLATPDADDTQNLFSDQTPSTLPSHDPLAPHRSDPVSDTLNTPRDRDDDGRAARDHLREYGGYLRPARVKPQDPAGDNPNPRHRK